MRVSARLSLSGGSAGAPRVTCVLGVVGSATVSGLASPLFRSLFSAGNSGQIVTLFPDQKRVFVRLLTSAAAADFFDRPIQPVPAWRPGGWWCRLSPAISCAKASKPRRAAGFQASCAWRGEAEQPQGSGSDRQQLGDALGQQSVCVLFARFVLLLLATVSRRRMLCFLSVRKSFQLGGCITGRAFLLIMGWGPVVSLDPTAIQPATPSRFASIS